jgi:hypothetical protein
VGESLQFRVLRVIQCCLVDSVEGSATTKSLSLGEPKLQSRPVSKERKEENNKNDKNSNKRKKRQGKKQVTLADPRISGRRRIYGGGPHRSLAFRGRPRFWSSLGRAEQKQKGRGRGAAVSKRSRLLGDSTRVGQGREIGGEGAEDYSESERGSGPGRRLARGSLEVRLSSITTSPYMARLVFAQQPSR